MLRGTRRRSKKRNGTRKQQGGANILHIHDKSKIRVFTCADKMKPTLEALMQSLEHHHYSYEVLGYREPWKNLAAKIKHYYKASKRYAKEMGADALMVCIDAYDMLCIQDAEVLYKKYMERKPRSVDNKPAIIIGAETRCHTHNCNTESLVWYDRHKIRGGKTKVLSETPANEYGIRIAKSPTFINSGFIMGPAGELELFFKKMMTSKWHRDQLAVGWIVSKNLHTVDLDLEEKFTRNKIETLEKQTDEGSYEGPAFIHFPGNKGGDKQKDILERYTKYMTIR